MGLVFKIFLFFTTWCYKTHPIDVMPLYSTWRTMWNFGVTYTGSKEMIPWQTDTTDTCLEGVPKALSQQLGVSYINTFFFFNIFTLPTLSWKVPGIKFTPRASVLVHSVYIFHHPSLTDQLLILLLYTTTPTLSQAAKEPKLSFCLHTALWS